MFQKSFRKIQLRRIGCNSNGPYTVNIGIEGSINVAAINGWEVDHTGYIEISAGHKKKDELKFDLAGADVESADQLETLEINFTYTISGLYTFTDTKPVTIYF